MRRNKNSEFSYTSIHNAFGSGIQHSSNLNDKEKLKAVDYLVTLSTESQSYCVGVVDVMNSTRTAALLGGDKIAKYHQIFFDSMSRILSSFEGVIMKNMGDCVLYYFPDSNHAKYNFYKVLECVLAMVESRDAICEKLKEEGLPEVDYRISMDYGTTIKMSTNDPHRIDLIGPPINMCSKINSYAHKNGVVLGGDMHKVVKKLKGYDMRQVADYSLGSNKHSYPVYLVTRQNILPSSLPKLNNLTSIDNPARISKTSFGFYVEANKLSENQPTKYNYKDKTFQFSKNKDGTVSVIIT